MKWSHERKVRSFANETFGSTLTGSAMRFAAVRCSSGCVDMVELDCRELWRMRRWDGGGEEQQTEDEEEEVRIGKVVGRTCVKETRSCKTRVT